MSKKMKAVVIAACIVVVLLLAAGALYFKTELMPRTVDEQTSPDGEYSAALLQIGEADFPFGSVKARVVIKKDAEVVARYDASIADDGANLTDQSWTLDWDEDVCTVTLVGSEQEPETVTVQLSGGDISAE